ncbi:putative MAP kinase [Saccharata proteae CBS 121410]|uniref:MAP kinase n=1 Tax=Saccharata proteae CBS 121410 TaxID=1314787 RepID=A0A9P4I385_9PEZI|nr:putative MAP kinase [Saccharata proteae CBS 121410]
MSTPAPLLRPPIPGSRSTARTPRLTLGIPPSPNARPVVNGATQEVPAIPTLNTGQPPLHVRPQAPLLRLATPLGSNTTPQEGAGPKRPKLGIVVGGGLSASGSSDASAHSRSGSFGEDGPPSLGSKNTSHDPLSALTNGSPTLNSNSTEMQRSNSSDIVLPDLEKLRIDKGGELEPDFLDDAGWRAASKESLIEELGGLGEGAGGAVTRCKLRGGKTVFALKIITTNPDPAIKRQIVRELSFNASLNHPSICRYYGAFQPPNNNSVINIAMEFCEGGSLDSINREVLARGSRVGEKVLGVIARGVLEGLTYLHSKRIIHRDIKPSNILLARGPGGPGSNKGKLNAWEGIVKLCDFGVSGEFGTKGMADTFIGTSYYMAPERIQGLSYTITSDVWSLGVTLLEVAQARFPFPADAEGGAAAPKAGLIDLLTYIVSQPIPKLKDEPQNRIVWGEGFKYFIECCLEKSAHRRASPWRLMEHPWMIEMNAKKVNMDQFLRAVWDWKD